MRRRVLKHQVRLWAHNSFGSTSPSSFMRVPSKTQASAEASTSEGSNEVHTRASVKALCCVLWRANINLLGSDGVKYSWGRRQVTSSKTIASSPPSKSRSLMAWECMSSSGPRELHFFDGNGDCAMWYFEKEEGGDFAEEPRVKKSLFPTR